MTIVTEEEIKRVLSNALSPGDDVLIHASLKPLGTLKPGPDGFIDALLDAVGHTGTVVMMTATRSFAETGRFSVEQPSETGLLTETFRKRQEVRRSLVPMVSFAAQGARASEYLHTYHSHLDSTAPITRLLENDGKILLLGIGYEKCTLYHLAEERHATPYNVYKTFSGSLIGSKGEIAPISQRYFVRRDMTVRKDPVVAGKMLEERGEALCLPLGEGKLRCFQARNFDSCCMEALDNNQDAFIRNLGDLY